LPRASVCRGARASRVALSHSRRNTHYAQRCEWRVIANEAQYRSLRVNGSCSSSVMLHNITRAACVQYEFYAEMTPLRSFVPRARHATVGYVLMELCVVLMLSMATRWLPRAYRAMVCRCLHGIEMSRYAQPPTRGRHASCLPHSPRAACCHATPPSSPLFLHHHWYLLPLLARMRRGHRTPIRQQYTFTRVSHK